MNQGYSVGPSKSIKVFTGDKIDVEVYAYYEQSSGWGTTNAPLTTLVTAIAGAFGGVSGAVGESGSIFSGVNTALGGFGLGPNAGDGAPSAFLNYILFDKNYKVMNMGWKVVPTTARFAKQRVTLPTINVKEAGYLFTYLSYEDQSNNYVYFDDYKVTYTPTNVVQYNEYYPYGLVTNNSWTKENAVGNNFLGNGGTELNTTTSLYDLEYRNYDPALARMHQVDPMADKYASFTPYNYNFNAPSNFNDRNGADPSPGEPDHVTRRGYQVLMANFDTAFPSGGGSGTLFDNIWGAVGFNNIGGIQNAGPNTAAADRYTDAQAVKAGLLSPQEYGAKYGDKNYWMSYREKENSDGSISGGFYLYNDQSYWKDEPNDFSSTRIPLAFAVYKNGAGSEYWGGKASNGDQETDPRVKALIAGTGFFLNATQTMTDYTLAFPKPTYYGPNEWKIIKASGKAFSRGLGVLGLAITAVDFSTSKQLKSEHILDATFGIIGFLPGAGPLIAGSYFLANTITIMSTGASIGDHLDSYLDELAIENAKH